jgi:phytoene dehydrogenase-like protein
MSTSSVDSSRYDAVVIGAGMSGLAAGLRLAQFDKRVVVLERHYLWGGLNSFYKHNGRRFDSGLHALTNYVPRHVKNTPLPRMLRQLRIAWEELELGEQTHSEIRFPDLRLRFANQFGLMEEDVTAAFPRERDGFARLVEEVRTTDPFDPSAAVSSARTELARFVRDPLLVDAILLPICWYGSAREDDIDWDQFVILFRSLFLEGFARPRGGIKRLLDLLTTRLRAAGGELRMQSGVARILTDARGAARGVVLDDGTELRSDCILSSAGWPETMSLCGRDVPVAEKGQLSFVESLYVLDRRCDALGHDATVTFFNTTDTFRWRRPEELVDVESGVLCATDNYASDPPATEGLVRITSLADHDRWCALDEDAYRGAKVTESERVLDAARPFGIDPRPHSVDSDMFTPRTIRYYTGRVNGAVYGSPQKRRDGETGIENVHLLGTDQGLVGVVGALMSGVTMANRHVLMPSASAIAAGNG